MQNIKIRKGSKEEYVFGILTKKANDLNVAVYDSTKSDKKDYFYRGYAVLKQMGVVIRISPHTYLINPNYFTPFDQYKQKVLQHWLEVTNKNH